MAMNEYLKTYKIEVQLEPSNTQQFQKEINDVLGKISKDSKSTLDKATSDKITKEFTEYQENLRKIETLKSDIAKISLLGDTKENRELYESMVNALIELKEQAAGFEKGSIGESNKRKQQDKEEKESRKAAIKGAIEEIAQYAKNKLNNLVSSVIGFAKDAWDELTDMASYNLSNSLVINREAREQAMMYGLSDNQNYAFTRVKEEMGIQSDEDLFYMNEAQRERFAERMGYYTNKYDELQQSGLGETIQEFQIEFSEFKEEVIMDIAQFFVNNKDEIKTVLKGAMEFFEYATQALSWLISFLGKGKERSSTERVTAANEILKNISTVSKTNNTNMNMSPQYNFYGNENSAKVEEIQRQQFEQLYKAYSQ